MKEKILLSACLLGTPCRYDGKSKPCADLELISDRYEFIPICPEVLGGLDTPRLPCEIAEGKVIRSDGKDLTEPYQKGARIALKIARDLGCKKAILKEKSPSCGTHFRYDGSFSGTLTQAMGITATLLKNHGIEIFSEDQISML